MGTIHKGVLTQNFKIRLNAELLASYIAEKISETIENDKNLSDVDIDEYYFEDDELVIAGSYSTKYVSSHFDRTLETPEEDELDREYIGEDPWFLADLPKEIKENLSVWEVKEDEDMVVDDRHEW